MPVIWTNHSRGQLTTDLALWWLCMMAMEETEGRVLRKKDNTAGNSDPTSGGLGDNQGSCSGHVAEDSAPTASDLGHNQVPVGQECHSNSDNHGMSSSDTMNGTDYRTSGLSNFEIREPESDIAGDITSHNNVYPSEGMDVSPYQDNGGWLWIWNKETGKWNVEYEGTEWIGNFDL